MELRVILPTLGKSRWLTETLESILGTEASSIVIVAPQSFELPATRDGRVRLIHQKGSGLYAALNQGLKPPGEWDAFTWLNDDDVFLKDGFARSCEQFVSDSAADVQFGGVEMIDSLGQAIIEMPATRRGEDVGPLIAAGVVPFNQPGTLIRRRAANRVGEFDADFRAAGDLDYFCRLAEQGLRFAKAEMLVAKFRIHAGQISSQQDTVRQETAKIVARAQSHDSWRKRSVAARWRFRWDNRQLYWKRVRRHGFVTMEDLYAGK